MKWIIIAAILLFAAPASAQLSGQEVEKYFTLGARQFGAARYPEALANYQIALGIVAKTYGGSDERALPVLEKIYEIHVIVQNWSAAESDRRQALQIVTYSHAKDDPAIAREKLRMARFLAQRVRYPECEGLYREAIASLSASPIAAHDEAPAMMDELAHILRIDEKDREAGAWEDRAKRIRMNRYQ